MSGLGEFERIARFFTPLVEGQSDALGLTDDAALVTPPAGKRMAVTADALVAGVHFLPDDPADRVARKALRVNISDLAAMGAEPYGYTITLALPRDMADAEAWIERFARGQAEDHAEYGIRLLGGDSVSTPGPLSISITAFGWVPSDQALTRGGARPGDDIYVSGTIGDSFLGLAVLQGDDLDLAESERAFLTDRYHLPQPRPRLGLALLDVTGTALDVSDGLLQDLGHICEVSRVGAEVELSLVPLSGPGQRLVAAGRVPAGDLVTGGDDYELLFTAPESARSAVFEHAGKTGIPVTRIGKIRAGDGVDLLDQSGKIMALGRRGYTHA